MNIAKDVFDKSKFPNDFIWGVATSAPQIEGAYLDDNKGLSIWDVFSKRTGKIKGKGNLNIACNFYYRYKDDLLLAKALGFSVFRFSIAWTRIIPDGKGKINQHGIRFYQNVIEECLSIGLTPYVTLFHWDLPFELQKEGGWKSHFIIQWFNRFVSVCCKAFGDKVKHWMVLNEPLSFTALGYMLGVHAPGKKGLSNFIPTVFNAALAQSEGAKVVKSEVSKSVVGTTFSCSEIIPFSNNDKDIAAAKRVDAIVNRLFIEPLLGLGFPNDDLELLHKINFSNKAWRYYDKMKFDFDFIGLQNYFPITIKHSNIVPIINAIEVKPKKRKVDVNYLGWEINANSFSNIIKQFASYPQIKKIIITENGGCFDDKLIDGVVYDKERINYFETHLKSLHKLIKTEPKVNGYMAWSLLDNFEWAEGYTARFGLVYVDFNSQLRTIKESGYWWRNFLK